LIESTEVDRITPHLSAVTAKGWLQRLSEHAIDLNDLFMRAIDQVIKSFENGEFPEDSPEPSKDNFNARLAAMESAMATCVRLGIVIAAWGDESCAALLTRGITRLAKETESREIGRHHNLWQGLALYPAALLWHSSAVAAFVKRNAATLRGLIDMTFSYKHSERSALDRLHMFALLCNQRELLQGYERHFFGESYHLVDILKNALREELFVDDPKGVVFTFDYFLLLVSASDKTGHVAEWIFTNEGARWPVIPAEMLSDIEKEGDGWIGVRAQAFSNAESAIAGISGLEQTLQGYANGGQLQRELPGLVWWKSRT
jgi:hypothetical protein